MLDGFFGMTKSRKNWHQIFWVWFTENSSKRTSTVYFSGNTGHWVKNGTEPADDCTFSVEMRMRVIV